MWRQLISLSLVMCFLFVLPGYSDTGLTLPTGRRAALMNEIANLKHLLGQAINRQKDLRKKIKRLDKQSQGLGKNTNDELGKLAGQLKAQKKIINDLKNTLAQRKKALNELRKSYKKAQEDKTMLFGIGVGLFTLNVLQFLMGILDK